MQFSHMEGGGVPPVRNFQSAASKTWVQGYIANLESGRLDNYTTGDTAVAGVCVSSVALSTAAGYNVELILADPRAVFEAYYYSTAASLNSTQVGSRFKPMAAYLNKINTTAGAATTYPLLLVKYDNTLKKAWFKFHQSYVSEAVAGV